VKTKAGEGTLAEAFCTTERVREDHSSKDPDVHDKEGVMGFDEVMAVQLPALELAHWWPTQMVAV
jgi:hypothetical protein